MAESALRKPDPLVFDENIAENWRKFELEFDVYCQVCFSDANDKQKSYLLLNLAGSDAIEKEQSFVYGEGESKEKLKTLKQKFEEVCKPQGNVIIDRHKFLTRAQLDTETMLTYISSLRILVKPCKYGDLADEMVRDRIVCGIKSDTVRKQLLKEATLTLTKAVEICKVHEVSLQHTREINDKANNSKEVNAIHNKPNYSSKRPKPSRPMSSSISNCINCGGSHAASRKACHAFGKTCTACGKPNHFAPVCKSSKPPDKHYDVKPKRQFGRKHTHELDMDDSDDDLFEVHGLQSVATKNEIHCSVNVNGQDVPMKIDTGAKCNVMSLQLFKAIRSNEKINRETSISLIAYGGTTMQTLGTTTINGVLSNQTHVSLVFHIIDKQVSTILGLEDALNLKLLSLHSAIYEVSDGDTPDSFSSQILSQYKDRFDDELGQLPAIYKMRIDESVAPVIKPARRIPIAMEQKVKDELDRMTRLGVIKPEPEPTEWVSYMVAAKKKSGEIRICIDPKDLNHALLRPHHPMKTVEDVASRMAGATVFSTLDAKASFWQMKLDQASSKRTTFATPFGRYRFLRMPFGISTASEVYQRTMEHLFAGYPCAIIVDDLLIWGSTVEEHDRNLHKVLERCREVNLKLNVKKCKFRLDHISYVGHEFTSRGLLPDSSKIEAIKNMPAPTDVAGVQRFLGAVNYLHKFIENLSEKTAALRQLLHKDTAWTWEDHHQKCFDSLKNELCHAPTLKYFNPAKQVKLTVDSSKSGLGAACLQDEAPIAYASRSLTSAELNYAQIEKELLAATFACSKFHDFIYGKSGVIIETDHKPLITIVKKPLHAAPPRLQRMLLQLQKYDLHFEYKCGKELYLADTLSRAYLDHDPSVDYSFKYEVMSISEVTALHSTKLQEMQEATKSDVILKQLMKMIKQGWPDKYKSVPLCLQPFFAVRDELSIQDGIVLKGTKVVIPESLQPRLIQQGHKGHPGIPRTTQRLKDIVFWPTIALDVEDALKKCATCNSMSSHQAKQSMIVPPVPDLPWTDISADIMEWNNSHYLVVVDSYSGWFELDVLTSMTSKSIISRLKRQFATHGIPNTLMTDNCPNFVSHEFKAFAHDWNFTLKNSSPFYAQSNGLAENAVKQAKKLLESCKRDGTDPMLALLNIRNIPRDDTLGSPAQRLMSRRTRGILPISKPLLDPTPRDSTQVQQRIEQRRYQQKRYYDKTATHLPPLHNDQTVRIQTPKGYDRLAVVKGHAAGPRSYIVTEDGKDYVRNRRHLKAVNEPAPQHVSEKFTDTLPPSTPATNVTEPPSQPTQSPAPAPPPSNLPPGVRVSSYGRVIKPNPKYADK